MKKTVRWKIFSLLLVTVIAGYYLFPTLSGRSSLPSLLPPLLPRAERLNLGLDLQGGMHLVLEVVTEKAVENTVDRLITELRREIEKEKIAVEQMTREGIDRIRIRLQAKEGMDGLRRILKSYSNLQQSGGADPAELSLSLTSSEIKRIQESTIQQSLETIRNRVDQFGVAEPHIIQEGDRRIIVQLPGIKEPQRAINLIGKTALLEFKMVAEDANIAEAVAGKVPEGGELLYIRRTEEGENVSKTPLVVQKRAVLTGDLLTSAQVQIEGQTNQPVVSIAFDREGTRLFGEATAANVGRRMAIVLDDTIYSAPVIREKIPGGKAQISGSFTMEEARDLAIVLRAGALPAPVNIISNLTVGPSLGQDSIEKGMRAAILGGALVIVFMAVYYRLSGVIANFALLLNLIWLVGALASLRATLTLPGIAGIILGIGMAVDSNVLILERIREELRLGKGVRSAIDGGYDKAFLTIIDSHVTTLITAFALFLFGTGPVKGFAVTLSLGVIFNLVTALTGTRVVYDWMTQRWNLKTLSI
ncbi:protein translocase subunit SecD [Candidatus Methylomirabilis limnetica]|uniref:protein translocase subunit SecD n=1 Tax=Candidatus Methylomirabilis limnetica TaxID=2033718 RepID=UPI00137975C3|nr:protein translocase subunit SecD [Candidatus Methylomirabilis limnetica]